jgi:hypothetical protein
LRGGKPAGKTMSSDGWLCENGTRENVGSKTNQFNLALDESTLSLRAKLFLPPLYSRQLMKLCPLILLQC